MTLGVTLDQPVVDESSPATWAVSMEAFADEREVVLDLDIEAGVELYVERSGRVTSLSCSKPHLPGTSPISIDGQPLVLLDTVVPPWRALDVGSRGADATAFNDALNRLGYEVFESDRFGSDSRRALRELFRENGATTAFRPNTLTDVIWMPEIEPDGMTCAVSVGDGLEAGDVVLRGSDRLAVARLQGGSAQSSLVPGRRVVGLEQLEFDVEADGSTVAVQSGVDRLQDTEAFGTWVVSAGEVPVTASLRLRDPISVAAVPPSAVLFADDGSCVIGSGGEAVGIEIVSSRAGQTIIQFTGRVPDRIEVAPQERTTCR